jgi:hypothetical protein
MSSKLSFTDTYAQTTGSVALGFSNHSIAYQASGGCQAPIFQFGVFGVSVSGSSGNFGINIMARAPDGTTVVVAGRSGLGAVKVAIPNDLQIAGTTWQTGIMRPYEIQYQRAVGTSISYTASVWGILYNP